MRRLYLHLMAVAYIVAGINHFRHPETYLRIMPRWLPAHRELVIISGIAEIVLGVLLFIPSTRRMAAWGIVALLVAVFPANVQMYLDFSASGHPQTGVAFARLLLQPVLIWWALLYTTGGRSQKMPVE